MAEQAASAIGPQIQYRIGINIGDIIIDGDDIFGDGVNVAARLEGIALNPAASLRPLMSKFKARSASISPTSASTVLRTSAARSELTPSVKRRTLTDALRHHLQLPGCLSSYCHSQTSAAIPSKSTSSMASPRA
jgi:hypothetical protein